jgi:hypothetical protein
MEEKEEREQAIARGSRKPVIPSTSTASLSIQHPLRYGLPILNNNNLANILKLSLDSQPHFSSTYLSTSSYFWLRACIPAQNPKQPKKYVVPAWVCMNTTTQPRLSEVLLAQRAAAAAEAETEAGERREE